MDWTGGTRRRYAATKNNAVLQKQKAHFAKVRAAHGGMLIPEYAKRSISGTSQSRNRSECGRLLPPEQTIRPGDEYARTPISAHDDHSFEGRQPQAQSATASIAGQTGAQHSGIRQASPVVDRKRESPLDDADRDLVAKKRSLLKRSDWLGLDATRPLTMKFPSAGDRDQIGKRRKIKKSGSQRAKPAGPRLLTPLFEAQLQPQQYFMSGALPADTIQIKIGTDASETQRSVLSRSPARQERNAQARNTSEFAAHLSVAESMALGVNRMRHRSIASDHMSEESMLLGGENDTFDARSVVIPVQQPRYLSDISHSMSVAAGTQAIEHTTSSHEYAHQPSAASNHPASHHHMHSSIPEYGNVQMYQYGDDYRQYAMIDQPSDVQDLEPYLPVEITDDVAQLQRELAESVSTSTPLRGPSPQPSSRVDPQWKRLLNFPKKSSSHASRLSLKSSSQHDTTSEGLTRVDQDLEQSTDQLHEQHVSTPKGVGTQASFVRDQLDDTSSEAPAQSPSASLKQITDFAQERAISRNVFSGKIAVLPQPAQPQDAADEAEWRQLFIGSRSSAGEQHDDERHKSNEDEDEMQDIFEQPHKTIPVVTREHSITYDEPANGTSLFVTGRTLFRAIQWDILATDDNAQEGDSIQDASPSPVRANRPVNMHADSAAALNPKRSKRPAKRTRLGDYAALGKGQKMVSRRAKTKRTAQHSIYDLVDTDGISIES